MAEQVGVVKLDGPMNGISFYKSRGKYLARSIGKVSPERRKFSPEFTNNRYNESEFGSAGKLSGRIRGTVMGKEKIPYNDLHNRISKVLISIIKSDKVNDWGKRNFFKGEIAKLKCFNFNRFLPLEHTYFGKIEHSMDLMAGKASVSLQFTPVSDIKAPSGANQVRISTSMVSIPSKEAEVSEQIESAPQYSLFDNRPMNFNFEIIVPAHPSEKLYIHLIKIEFLQEVNGKTYAIKEKGGIVLTVLDVMV